MAIEDLEGVGHDVDALCGSAPQLEHRSSVSNPVHPPSMPLAMHRRARENGSYNVECAEAAALGSHGFCTLDVEGDDVAGDVGEGDVWE